MKQIVSPLKLGIGIGLSLVIFVGALLIGRWTVNVQAINHTTFINEVDELPIFEIASLHVFGTSHGTFEIERDAMLGFIPRGQTTLTYQYSWSFLLGTPEPVVPRLLGDVIVLAKSDLEIGIIGEVAVFDFYEVNTSTSGWLPYRVIPTEHTFYLIDRARLTIEENADSMTIQIEFARMNMMTQLQAMYEALGFEVEWI